MLNEKLNIGQIECEHLAEELRCDYYALQEFIEENEHDIYDAGDDPFFDEGATFIPLCKAYAKNQGYQLADKVVNQLEGYDISSEDLVEIQRTILEAARDIHKRSFDYGAMLGNFNCETPDDNDEIFFKQLKALITN